MPAGVPLGIVGGRAGGGFGGTGSGSAGAGASSLTAELADSVRIGRYPDVLQRPGEFPARVYRGTDLVPEAAPCGFPPSSGPRRVRPRGTASSTDSRNSLASARIFPAHCPTVRRTFGISLGPTTKSTTTLMTRTSVQPMSSIKASVQRRAVPLRFGRFVGFRSGGGRRCGFFSAPLLRALLPSAHRHRPRPLPSYRNGNS